MIYFSFTTLSSVGLGDYHPKNSAERLAMVPIMFFGFMIFTYIAGELNTHSERLYENS